MAAAAVPLVSAGIGALGGLFGGGNKIPDWQKDIMQYWDRRSRDQEMQGTKDYGENYGNILWGPSGWEDFARNPGYSGEEAAGLFLSPEEQAAMYLSPEEQAGMYLSPEEQAGMFLSDEEQAGMYLSPEEQAALRISPEEEAGIMSATLAPIAGSVQRATDALQRAQAARGGVSGSGYGANIQRVEQEAQRNSADAALRARLGITSMRREGERDIASQRIGALRDIAGQRTDTTGQIAGQRLGAQRGIAGQRTDTAGRIGAQRIGAHGDIAGRRVEDRRFGQLGRQSLLNMDLQRMLGYRGGDIPGTQQQSGWQRAAGGAAMGALAGLTARGSGSSAPDWTDEWSDRISTGNFPNFSGG